MNKEKALEILEVAIKKGFKLPEGFKLEDLSADQIIKLVEELDLKSKLEGVDWKELLDKDVPVMDKVKGLAGRFGLK